MVLRGLISCYVIRDSKKSPRAEGKSAASLTKEHLL